MKNLKDLLTKFDLLTELGEKVKSGEIVLPLSQINDEKADVSANIVGAINEECDATIVADAFGVGGCDDPETALIKAKALMVALDEGVALLNKRTKVDHVDTAIIAEKVLISAAIENKNKYSDEELKKAKNILGPNFVKIASKFAEAIRTYSSRCRHDAIDKLTISYARSIIEIYRG